ncbi:Hypothetical predicted protein [Cloeon dipterum]|uniref:Uncharacterized protein n=1 Tax=Cloeon dipterum TaxID=197152 RepID=A0A8S1DTM6_9INSE|nr:Hypothetical predicted protein [Cloeon dipterum]
MALLGRTRGIKDVFLKRKLFHFSASLVDTGAVELLVPWPRGHLGRWCARRRCSTVPAALTAAILRQHGQAKPTYELHEHRQYPPPSRW